jgi:hypothetical protein
LENEENERNDEEKKVVEVRMVVQHRNLAEMAAAIAECFMKASVAGEAVLQLTENDLEQKSESVTFIYHQLFFELSFDIHKTNNMDFEDVTDGSSVSI